MSSRDAAPNHSERREAAARWLVRLEGETTDAEWAAFEQWLTDPYNRKALSEIESALELVDDHRSAFAEQPKVRRRSPVGAGIFVGLAIAAAAVLFVALQPPPVQSLDYEAPPTAVRVVQLPDGSVLTLNRGAAARVQWRSDERRVLLARGEAAFRVVHNEQAPFTVMAGNVELRDIGTEFNVLRTPSQLTVTIREGAVGISAATRSATLRAGDRAIIAGGQIQTRRVEAEDAFAWREGRLVYRDAPMSEVIEDLNRYSPTPVRLADSNVAALRFSGVLVIDAPTAMTARLEAFLPIRSEHNASGIVIRSR